MNIILIGYRGSGKTTVGRLLGERLGRAFLDSDEQIVAGVRMTIREIFERVGEGGFRAFELGAVLDFAGRDNHVFSLGGGTLLREENRRAISGEKHFIVYLRAEPVELHRRIHADAATAANRPALTTLGGGIEEIRSVLATREPIYREMSHVEIDVTELSPEQVVDRILEALPEQTSK